MSFPFIKSISLLILVIHLTLNLVSCQTNSTIASQNSSWSFQSFRTAKFHPPDFTISKSGETAKGYLFLAPSGPLAYDVAPLIMTDTNELIWQGLTGQAFNFGVQNYKDKPVLTYWNGTVFPEPVGRGSGSVHILDNTYQEIAVVSLYDGVFLTLNGTSNMSNIDLHEIYITERNTVLVTANNVTQTDLRSVGGPESGWVVDSLVYEIDIETKKTVFRWRSLDHLEEIPLTDSLYPLGSEGFMGTKQSNAWGYFHINAVAPYDGGYLLSSRYLCSAIAIDGEGNVRWRLQGRDGGQFKLGNGTNFCYQHDIRAANSSSNHVTLTMHDNANCPINNGSTPTSGLALDVDLVSLQVELNSRYFNTKDKIFSTAQGNYQRLNDGHIFLGHGYYPKIEEFEASGSVIMTLQFGVGVGVLSYRAFRQMWIGCPNFPPTVVAEVEDGETVVYMSWNGATEYDSWAIYSGDDATNLTLTTTASRGGFETRIPIGITSFVQVEAIMVEPSQTCECEYAGGSKSIIYTVQQN